MDRLALKVADSLKTKYPNIEFSDFDPIENLDPEFIIMDVAEGIDKVTMLNDLKKIEQVKLVSLHSFGIETKLKLMQKKGVLKKFNLILIPIGYDLKKAIKECEKIISNLF